MYVWLVSPSAAVTVTTSSFSPASRSAPPEISTVAPASEASAATSTEVVPMSRSTTSPSATSEPFTVNVVSEVSLLLGRTSLTVYV